MKKHIALALSVLMAAVPMMAYAGETEATTEAAAPAGGAVIADAPVEADA